MQLANTFSPKTSGACSSESHARQPARLRVTLNSNGSRATKRTRTERPVQSRAGRSRKFGNDRNRDGRRRLRRMRAETAQTAHAHQRRSRRQSRSWPRTRHRHIRCPQNAHTRFARWDFEKRLQARAISRLERRTLNLESSAFHVERWAFPLFYRRLLLRQAMKCPEAPD